MDRFADKTCQSMQGKLIDAAVSEFIVAAVNQDNIALALSVRDRVRADFAAADQQRLNHIESLRYKADLARQRFMEVDPKHRLVAATLESEWNLCLDELEQSITEREHNTDIHNQVVSQQQDQRILELSSDFGLVWHAPHTDNTQRKQLLGQLIEDATLTREDYQVRIDLRLRGGKQWSLPPVELPKPAAIATRRDADDAALAVIKDLLHDGFNDARLANELNHRGHRDSRGDRFTRVSINLIRQRKNWSDAISLKRQQLRNQGYSSASEIGAELGISASAVRKQALRKNDIDAHVFKVGERQYCMYKLASENIR